MIIAYLPWSTALYRGHSPKWAYAPTSGAGAATAGGRFNRPGVEALYLSLEVATALAEYTQTSLLLPPCTVCTYLVGLTSVVDLRQLHDGPPWDDLWKDWMTDWRHSAFDLKVEPPTWVLSDIVRGAGHAGIIFPSVANSGGSNVVIYSDALSAPNRIEVHDPNKLLPADQSSWPT